ncbi:MAG: hypothetical protein ACREB1_09040, partial [Sphingomicrobium sp.]
MRKLLLSFLLAAGAIAPGHAQQAQLPGDDQPSAPIVVQGVRDQIKEIGRFIDALTDAPAFGQLSRFDWAVCPASIGLGDPKNAVIVQRMTQVARAAVIPVAKPGCRPNVLLIVTRDKGALIDELGRKYPAYFEGVSNAAIKQMKRDPSPAAAWHVQGLLDADGVEAQRDLLTGQRIIERTDISSRLSTMSRPHFIAAVVVVELDALGGLTVTQLADYAAMRAFARTDPRRLKGTGAPTILSAIVAPMNSPV